MRGVLWSPALPWVNSHRLRNQDSWMVIPLHCLTDIPLCPGQALEKKSASALEILCPLMGEVGDWEKMVWN